MTTKGLHKRIAGHVAKTYSTNVPYFSNAVKKYGIDAFHFSILEECPDRETASQRERDLIAERKPEYNIAAGGVAGPQGWKHSEESRRKMSAGNKRCWLGKKRSPESMAKVWETRRARGNASSRLGKKHSPETIAKIAEGHKKPVRCLNDGREFASAKEASVFYNLHNAAASSVARGKVGQVRGFRFEYIGVAA